MQLLVGYKTALKLLCDLLRTYYVCMYMCMLITIILLGQTDFLHLGTKHFEWCKCSKEQDAKVAPKKSIQKGTAKICICIFFVFSM